MALRSTVRLSLLTLLLFVPMRTTAQAGPSQTPPHTEAGTEITLRLSESQHQALRRLHIESAKKAAPAAKRLADIVRQIYENMLADAPSERRRTQLSVQMQAAVWKLLTLKGQTLRETVRLLTPRQRQRLRSEMRKPGAPSDLADVLAHTFPVVEK